MQKMEYHEREALKRDWGEESKLVILMIAHWHRQTEQIPFSEYAANWAVACGERAKKIQEVFPLKTKRMIKDGYSDWNSFNDPRYI